MVFGCSGVMATVQASTPSNNSCEGVPVTPALALARPRAGDPEHIIITVAETICTPVSGHHSHSGGAPHEQSGTFDSRRGSAHRIDRRSDRRGVVSHHGRCQRSATAYAERARPGVRRARHYTRLPYHAPGRSRVLHPSPGCICGARHASGMACTLGVAKPLVANGRVARAGDWIPVLPGPPDDALFADR